MLYHNKEGELLDINLAALELLRISQLKGLPDINLFNNPIIPCKKDEITEEGVTEFQIMVDFSNVPDSISLAHNSVLLKVTVSTIDSGYLLQIQESYSQKEAEELLITEERYRSFFEEDLTGDFIATPAGELIECNPAFAEIYGFISPEEASKSNIADFNPEDWKDLIRHLETRHKIQGRQTTHRRQDGKEIHIVSNVVARVDENGQITQVKGYVFDDTERKEAEEALKRSEEKYHRLFDEDLTGDFIATIGGEILECNPAFAEIYGFSTVEDALKWNISHSNPFDWPYMVTRLKNEGKILGFQSWQRRSDVMRIHVVANMVGIFNDSGDLIQVKGYIFNDTERKQAEDRLESGKKQITHILDSIQDGFMALDNLWNFIYVNRCAADYLGIDADDLLGRNIWDRLPDFVGTIYETSFREAMNQQKVLHFKAPGIHKMSSCFDFSVYPSSEGISIYWRDINR
jgi:PAS domain S-box-containing protein